jgi:hypothetical protein
MNLVKLFEEPIPNPRTTPKELAAQEGGRQLWCDFNERDKDGYVITDAEWAEDGFDLLATASIVVGDDDGNRCNAVIRDRLPNGLILLDVDWGSFVPAS